jgi:hypothetical protein
MSDSEHPTEWYLARDSQQFGPLSDVELKKFVELGHLRPTDLLWRQGFADWRPAASLFPAPHSAPPTAAPEPSSQASRGTTETPQASRWPAETERPSAEARTAGGAAERPQARSAPASGKIGGPAPQAEAKARRVSAIAASAPTTTDGAARKAAARPRRRFPWASAIFCLGFVALAGGALVLHQSGNLSALMSDFGLHDIAEPAATKAETPRAAVVPAVRSQPAVADENLKRSPLAGFSSSPVEVDANFQQSTLWRLLKKEFPDWYEEQVKEAARLRGEQKDDRAIAQQLAVSLVTLRRKHMKDALAADPQRLRLVASSFLDNLGRLAAHSVEACYGFISQGETSPMVVELFRSSEHTPYLQAQVMAVFEAITEGRKSPQAHPAPRREDYDALAKQLGQRGWTPADLQLFSDARALSRAPPQKVCQMVQDWFAAQLAVKDEAVQMRLLVEALKPVVAG